MYDMRSSEDSKVLTDRALSLGADLIIIDALADLMRASENGVASVQDVLFNLRRLADLSRAAVLVLHHTNRRGRFRGSSAINASVDLMLAIDSSPTDSYIEFRALKARFSAPLPFAANAVFSTTTDGKPTVHLETAELRPESSLVSPLSISDGEGSGVRSRPALTLSILEFLSRNPNSTRAQVIAHCPLHDEGSVSNAIYFLIDQKKIVRTNEGANGKPAAYSLVAGELV